MSLNSPKDFTATFAWGCRIMFARGGFAVEEYFKHKKADALDRTSALKEAPLTINA